MKIAYLILTHKNPKLLKRMIQVLSSEDCAFFILVDQKSDISGFSDICGENVFVTGRRIPVHWGEFSGVRAPLLLLRQAMESSQHFDYFVYLSGSDYPLRSREYIHAYLEANRGIEFMTLIKVPAPGKPLSRINTLRFESDKPVRRFVSKAMAKLGLAQRDYRNYLGNLQAYSGRALWALTGDACRYLLEFIAQNPHVERFFENAFAPDEAFFHTILGNSEYGPYVRGNFIYEDWSAGGAHPAMIDDGHIELFRSREKVFDGGSLDGPVESLFARKFSDENLHLLDAIDVMIAQKEGR